MMVKFIFLINNNEECCCHLLSETTPVLRLLFTLTANGCNQYKVHNYKCFGSFSKEFCFRLVLSPQLGSDVCHRLHHFHH